jgi:hypothetical protein
MTEHDQKRTRRGLWVTALLASGTAWACGGMTTEDASGGAAGQDGGVGSGGTVASGGTSPQLVECDAHSDCVVDSASCCSCEPVSAEDLQAVRADWVDPAPECNCEPCPDVTETETARQYFIAECHSGQCELVDLRDDFTECSTGEDCLLREGSDCCEGCDGRGYIAVSSFEFVGEERCDDVACDPCLSSVPAGLSAQCDLDTNHCAVVEW